MNEQSRNRLIDTENRLRIAGGRGVGELGEKGEGFQKYKMVVTKQSQGCKVQHREDSQWYCNNDVWCELDTRYIHFAC